MSKLIFLFGANTSEASQSRNWQYIHLPFIQNMSLNVKVLQKVLVISDYSSAIQKRYSK
jgi:hypothetical protein